MTPPLRLGGPGSRTPAPRQPLSAVAGRGKERLLGRAREAPGLLGVALAVHEPLDGVAAARVLDRSRARGHDRRADRAPAGLRAPPRTGEMMSNAETIT